MQIDTEEIKKRLEFLRKKKELNKIELEKFEKLGKRAQLGTDKIETLRKVFKEAFVLGAERRKDKEELSLIEKEFNNYFELRLDDKATSWKEYKKTISS